MGVVAAARYDRIVSGWFPHMNEAQDEPCGPSVHFLGHLVVITNGYLVRNLDESPVNDIPLAFRHQGSAEHGKMLIPFDTPQ